MLTTRKMYVHFP